MKTSKERRGISLINCVPMILCAVAWVLFAQSLAVAADPISIVKTTNGKITIFEDGFETGDFSKWNPVVGSPTVTSGEAHQGTYKAVISTAGAYAQARYTLDPMDHAFMRAYVMFKAFPAAGAGTTVLGVYNLGGQYMAEARVVNVGGTVKWALRYYHNGTHYTVNSELEKPILDTWYMVEVEGISNSATSAESRIYINGTELTDVTQTGRNNPYQINCGYIWANTAVTRWYDDIVIAKSGLDGGFIPADDPVTWTYVVKNTDTVALTGVVVTDSDLGAITCPKTTLAVGESMTCKATGVAIAGLYENIGTVTGTDPVGATLSASDSSSYHGLLTEITVTTTGSPTEVPQTGGNVTFTYEVENTGDVPVAITSLSDDQFGTLTGDADCQVGTVLAAGAYCEFAATFAIPAGEFPGSHTNIFTAKATDAEGHEDTATEAETVTYTGSDVDSDGVYDVSDNCPSVANADQANYDGDSQGNACDADDDNDTIPDTTEIAKGTNPLNPDTDGDGVLDNLDPAPTNPAITKVPFMNGWWLLASALGGTGILYQRRRKD